MMASHSAPATPPFEASDAPGGGARLTFQGRLAVDNLERALASYRRFLAESHPASLVLDLSRLSYLDSAAVLGLSIMEREAAAQGATFSVVGLDQAGQGLKGLVDQAAREREPLNPAERRGSLVEQVGQSSQEVWRDFVELVSFLGAFLPTLLSALLRPRRLRWAESLFYMERVGVDGLAIVGTISLLLGLIIAFMSSLQLSSFGANIYVASLVSVAMVRELSPIMTAILVAGRSGSAFAAEIGTMKINEEVDALEVMGFDPLSFLALPKVVAAMAVLPLLTIYSCLAGIAGGLIVGVTGLNLTVYSYLQETMRGINAFAVFTALVKSVVFAIIIAGIGCQRGFSVRGGALGVGTATTSAVVTAMFLIIVADAGFAILFYYVW